MICSFFARPARHHDPSHATRSGSEGPPKVTVCFQVTVTAWLLKLSGSPPACLGSAGGVPPWQHPRALPWDKSPVKSRIQQRRFNYCSNGRIPAAASVAARLAAGSLRNCVTRGFVTRPGRHGQMRKSSLFIKNKSWCQSQSDRLVTTR